MKSFLTVISVLWVLTVNAGIVDTLNVPSASMNKKIKCVVIAPDNHKSKQKKFPVLYLLHGFSGNYRNWIARVPELKDYVDQHQMIIVCPDAGFSSWYFDSPIDSSYRYETFTAKELPSYIDGKYNTVKDRKGRAITGLSMGGHGGLYLGWRHANDFGAAGSMSGAIVIDRITKGFHVERRLGDTVNYADNFRTYSFMHEMEKAPAEPLAIIIDCGTEDFVIEMSRAAHAKMLSLKIPHDYIERPGAHNFSYWANAIKYQLLFFSEYFRKAGGARD